MTDQTQLLVQGEVAALYIKYAAVLINGTPIVATDQETYNELTILLSLVQRQEVDTAALYEQYYRPYKFEIDKLAADFKPRKDKIALAKAIIKKGMQDFLTAQAKATAAKQQEILSNPALPVAVKHEQIQSTFTPPPQNTRKELTLFITDLSQIPREFFNLDEQRLKAYLKEGGVVIGAHVDYVDKVIAK